MATPRLLLLSGVIALILFGSSHGDGFGCVGAILLVSGTALEAFLRAALRCPHCGSRPYVEATRFDFPMLRQPLVPLERCRDCGYEFD